jgi:hypothetical protein
MSRNRRKTLIERIEEARKSRVVVYVTGDRAPAAAQIADDAVRPLYDHLRKIEKADKLDLFLYAGAATSTFRGASPRRFARRHPTGTSLSLSERTAQRPFSRWARTRS